MDHPSLSSRRATFLDALGTLIRLAAPWPALRELLRERHGAAVSLDDARRAMVSEMAFYRANCIRAGDAASLARLRLDCARILREQLAPSLDHLGPEALVPTLLDALHFEPFEDVLPALHRWREGGLRLFVVSNWDISLHDVLRATGLRELLDGVVCSAEVGASKPDPAIFLAALELAGVAPGEVVHVGDSPEEDVAGALAAGIRPLLLRRDPAGAAGPADVPTVASLREL
jgi:putative hydrolase of the HAD superfamily